MTLEVRLHQIAVDVNSCGEEEKILGYVVREGEFQNGGLETRGGRKVPKKFENFL